MCENHKEIIFNNLKEFLFNKIKEIQCCKDCKIEEIYSKDKKIFFSEYRMLDKNNNIQKFKIIIEKEIEKEKK